MFRRLRENFKLLKRASEIVGKEFEERSYDDLLEQLKQIDKSCCIGDRFVEGKTLGICLSGSGVLGNGELLFFVNAHGLPTILGIKPSWHFYKRKDNTVHY